MTTHFRRVATIASAAALALSLGTGSALAFEPPSDPADAFSCDGGPVAGHPGADGLTDAMSASGNPTAWNATQGGQVTTC